MTPRVAPGGFADIGPVNWLACRTLSALAGVRDAKLFSTLARHRRLFRAWLVFAGRLMPAGSLSRQDTELAILRVAHLRRCDYEWRHHARLGRRAGLDDRALARIQHGPDAAGWTDHQRALLAAVDALVTTKSLDNRCWCDLRGQLADDQIIELCMLVGHYEMLATTIAVLGVAPDE